MEFKDSSIEPTEYEYDESGNLIKDLNKKITDIRYNSLTLSSLVEFENGNNISYVYAANGTKFQTMHVIGNDSITTDYCSNVIYENGVSRTLIIEAGYFSLHGNKHHYYLQIIKVIIDWLSTEMPWLRR